jgi:CRISPR-associated protein Cas6/Cse3/CasE subtype I-E
VHGLNDERSSRRKSGRAGHEFLHSVLSFTRLEIPEAEVFEAAVAFAPDTDPLTAHDRFAAVFGHRAGRGHFLFRSDSSSPGRYWVRSVEPWRELPEAALSALEPQRIVIQLADGLMYHFTLAVCVGTESVRDGQRHVEPYTTAEEFESWIEAAAEGSGFKLLMASAAPATLRFKHQGQAYKVQYGNLSGALEVRHAPSLRRQLLRGFGAHRRLGFGMLQLSA